MNYLMLRNFDQAGYYETRLILTIISLAIAAYFIHYKRDRRYLLIFGSGVLLHSLMEYSLWWRGLRNAEPMISFFGLTVPMGIAPIIHGFFEGGVVSMFAFWLADLRAAQAKRNEWLLFGLACVTVVILSFVVGFSSRGHAITSVRPIFDSPPIFVTTVIIFVCLIIAWRKDDISTLIGFFAGLLLFACLNYEPMHLMGARYVGIPTGASSFVAASWPLQIVLMFLSHVFEASGSKLHYFMLPYAFGLIALREEEQQEGVERYSTQVLQELTGRGWRRKSKPFTKN